MSKVISALYRLMDLFYFYMKGSISYARKKGVTIGDGCRIYISSWGSEPFLVTIGDSVTITSGVRIITHDGSTWLMRDEANNRYQKYAPVVIGSDVFIGLNTIIMPGVTIGSNVVIGAGSVVTKDIPSNSVAVGNPAKVVSDFNTLKNKIEKTCVNDKEIRHITDYKQRVYKAIELSEKKNEK